MAKIRELSESVVSKIAAGEVVDRPASVVKELVENAIDAKAVKIEVSLINSGFSEISVADDGVGMSPEDLKKSVKRHSTSKIRSITDIESINTFGFRGEALSSIASVSEFSIISREKSSIEGYKISLSSGELVYEGTVGTASGTKVSVRNLFYNVPARRKFLKSEAAELSLITEEIIKISISQYDKTFVLKNNSKEILFLRASQSPNERIKEVLSTGVLNNIISLDTSKEHFKLSGYISRPQLTRTSRRKQYLYVNGRSVDSKIVSDTVRRAYGTLVETRKYPVFVLFLELPPSLVDVNVHPKKTEVRFHTEERLIKFIFDSVKETLQANDITFIKEGYKKITDYMDTYLDEIKSLKVFDSSHRKSTHINVHNLYIIRASSRGLEIYDQHAAHERVLYNGLLELYKSENLFALLDNPIEILFDKSDHIKLEEYRDTFYEMGFDYELYAESKVKVTKVPRLLLGRNLEIILTEILDDIAGYLDPQFVDTRTEMALSYLACRSAVKAGDSLSNDEISGLFELLDKYPGDYTCPHGRPLKVEIPLSELHNWFKR